MAQAKKKGIFFGDFYKGITQSKYAQNGFDSLVGCDIHSETGSCKSSLAMIKKTASLVDGLAMCAIKLPNGDSFWGDALSGKIWKRTAAGVYSLVHTNTQGACLGMGYHKDSAGNGFLFYASRYKLGRIAESLASSEASWASQNDSWATFANGDPNWHTMFEQNESLFIADGPDLAAVDNAGNFSASGLDLQRQYRVISMTNAKSDLISGVYPNAAVFRWDTYSSSWSFDDYLEELGVNMFIKQGQFILAQVGGVGNIYPYTGEAFDTVFRQLRDTDNVISTTPHPYGSANLNGLSLIAHGRGIFSLGKKNRDLPIAMNIEYIPSQGQGVTPGAILTLGGQVCFAWKKGSTYGIDELDTNRCNAIITTPVILGAKDKVKVHYSLMPEGCSIGIEAKSDDRVWTALTAVQDDEDKRVVYTEGGIGNKSELQIRVTLNSNGANSPVITLIEVE